MEVRTLDDIPASAFHLRLALIAGGGPFCDGYILGIIGVVLPLLVSSFHLGANVTGLVGAASLAGVFVGGLAGGVTSDRFGRKILYTVNILMFTVFSAAQFFLCQLYGAAGLAFSYRHCHWRGLPDCDSLRDRVHAPALAWTGTERAHHLLVVGVCVQFYYRVCAAFVFSR